MLCSKCGKREVEVLIKQVINKEVHNLSLCRECAEQMGFVSPQLPSITISFSVSDPEPLKVKRKKSASRQKREEQENALVCTECGTRYTSFKETGLLGCPHCYGAFRFPLGAYLQEHQGAESHWGGKSEIFSDIALAEDVSTGSRDAAVLPDDSVEEERIRLKRELDTAVACEEYELAARIRDKLKALEVSSTDDDR